MYAFHGQFIYVNDVFIRVKNNPKSDVDVSVDVGAIW